MRAFFALLSRNPLGLLGVAVTTAAGVLIVSLFTFEAVGLLENPYVGILTYLILPAVFLLGLGLIPIGVWRERRRLARGGAGDGPRFPVLDLNRPGTRGWVLAVAGLTAFNLVIVSTATYKGVEVMESVEFCGTTCHVMQPEFTAHQDAPHSEVRCVECHIGPGAGWFVKSKLSGARQVLSVALDRYPRPIPAPVHDLRAASETCERCHSPTRFVGERLAVKTSYADDRAATGLKTVLRMHVGGRQGSRATGIHWHADPDVRIRYRSNHDRSEIYDVEWTARDGVVKRFHRDGDPASDPGDTEWRSMDCVDCHNRPAHVFELPEDAVDRAIARGEISRELPFVRREAVRLLREPYATHTEARRGLMVGLTGYYRGEWPEVAASLAPAIERAGNVLGTIYAANVFPEMAVTWGTYPDHRGHEAWPGCFRCHDEGHATPEGETLSQDCELCHAVLAWDEEDPQILTDLQGG